MITRVTATVIASLVALTTLLLSTPGWSGPALAKGVDRTSPVPGDTATVTAAASYNPGEDLTISGRGWLAESGAEGSTVAVLIDAPGPAVYTRRTVANPTTHEVSADKRLQAIAAADAHGDWSVTIPAPTPENAYFGDQQGQPSITPWTSGQVHFFRLLTGSLRDRDKVRSVRVEFCVGTCDTEAGQEPAWGHVTARHADGATAWVEDQPSPAAGAVLRVVGRGWLTADASGGSTIDVSFNRNGEGDPGSPYVVKADDAGNLEAEVPLPPGLEPGSYLTAVFRSGPYAPGDVSRSVTTETLKVGGVAYVPPSMGGVCTPTSPSPEVALSTTSVPVGGVITVTGKGWCHPKNGGSTIAVKIDDGEVSHTAATRVRDDLTIWAIVEADPKTGEFTADVTLPDGTTASSTPALTQGAHTLRFLTGTLKAGDTIRTLRSEEITVGAYRPNGIPDPVEATEDLTQATKAGLRVSRRGTRLTVTIPKAASGEWVYLNLYDGGSPLFPWGTTWLHADGHRQVKASLKGLTLPDGDLKLSAQSGNQGRAGKLLGWGVLRVAAPASAAPASVSAPPAIAPALSSLAGAVVPAPTQTPAAPLLTTANRGHVSALLSGTDVLLKTPAAPGAWVHVTLYAGDAVIPAGWLQTRLDGTVTLAAASLPAGEYRLAVQDPAGAMLGWTTFTLGATGTAPADSAPPAAGTRAAAAVASVAASLPLWRVRDLDAVLMVAAIALLAGTSAGIALGSRTPRRKLT